jgi:hypothetical protein
MAIWLNTLLYLLIISNYKIIKIFRFKKKNNHVTNNLLPSRCKNSSSIWAKTQTLSIVTSDHKRMVIKESDKF